MNKRIAEWYVKNRRKINILILAIIAIVIINIIVVILSNNTNKQQSGNTISHSAMQSDTGILKGYNTISPNAESVLSGDELDSHQKTQLDVINEFMEYCKQKDIEKAYEMISNECKEVMYPTIELFKTSYYDAVFDGQDKMISVENWNDNIYKVEIEDNALSTGIYNQGSTKQDYITTVATEDNTYALNINGYIGRQEINKTVSKDKFDIIVKQTDTYKDYQTFTFTVTNKSDKSILLDNKIDANSMYIEDKNEIQYPAYTHEISEAELVITPGTTKDITIKYYNKYSTIKEIKKIGFSNILLNYNENTKKEYQSIVIEL